LNFEKISSERLGTLVKSIKTEQQQHKQLNQLLTFTFPLELLVRQHVIAPFNLKMPIS